jgi:flagellar hook-basal body complex protein FliE
MMINEIAQAAKNLNVVSAGGEKKQINSGDTLAQTFENIFKSTEQNLQIADQTVLKANTGESVDLHEMMIAMEKADISLRLMVQVRNKAMDAYHEIMRMQI